MIRHFPELLFTPIILLCANPQYRALIKAPFKGAFFIL